MCCSATDYKEEEINGVCPDCGEETVDSDAYEQCGYATTECETCYYAPCDQSC